MVCTFEYYTFENLSSSSFKSLNFFEGQCKSTLLTRGKNSRKIYPHFPLKVFQIEFIISLFYHLTLFPTGFFFFFFSFPTGFFIFVFIVFPITRTSKSQVMLSSHPQQILYIFSPQCLSYPPLFSNPTAVLWPFLHSYFIYSYSIPYPLVSTGLDAFGDKEMDQIRDLFVLDYLSSRRLKILDYFYLYWSQLLPGLWH